MSNQLTWTVSNTGTKLHIGYRYENTGKTVVYVNDGAIQQVKDHLWKPLKTQFVTLTGPDTALLTIGVPPGTGTFPTPGLYAAVAPGNAFESSRDLETPLQARGADGRLQPLPKSIAKLALALELFEGEPPKWVEVKTATGTARFPERAPVQAILADAKPLP